MPPPEPGVELAAAHALGPAAVGAAEKDTEAGEAADPPTHKDANDGSSDGGLAKAAGDGAVVLPAKGEAAVNMHVPHPDAPAGLFYVSAERAVWLASGTRVQGGAVVCKCCSPVFFYLFLHEFREGLPAQRGRGASGQ